MGCKSGEEGYRLNKLGKEMVLRTDDTEGVGLLSCIR